MPSVVLRIASTWDGRALPERDVATVTVRLEAGGAHLQIDAPFRGDPPPPAAPGPSDRLWEFEVVEWFAAARVGAVWKYLEVELSPHGHHLVLRFEGPRNAVDRALPLDYRARIDRDSGRWTGDANIPAAYLPSPEGLLANAYAIHGPAGERVHHAATALPGSRPDFHQPHRFPPLFAKLDP